MNDDDSEEAVNGDKKIRDDELGFQAKSEQLLDTEDDRSEDEDQVAIMVSDHMCK